MIPARNEIENLARRAGRLARAGFSSRPGFGQGLEVEYKGVIDLVTEVDRRSEETILGEIKSRYPEDRILAEESGAKPGEACCVWFVDPLDGTINFAHGIPIYSISIAYQRDGLMQIGVVYDPERDECFSAELGQGAWLNGEPIKVSSTQELDQSLLVTGFPYDIRTNPETNLDAFSRFSLLTQGVRRLGSAALDLCYVAAGRFDGYWEIRLSPWDMAAGGLIAREAGGVVTDLRGGDDYLHQQSHSILAANSRLHAQMLAVLNSKE
jgi:myo-inositol-1(or 4)-monophosphatase